MIYKCINCNKEFKGKPSRNSKYCSQYCFGIDKRRRSIVKCSTCGNKIEKLISRLKNKSGLFFCNNSCRRIFQRSENCIGTSFYKNTKGNTSYNKSAFRCLPNKCNMCGNEELIVLMVHHKDKNRKNNRIDNLEILCHNCHIKRHLELKNGKLHYNTKVITGVSSSG